MTVAVAVVTIPEIVATAGVFAAVIGVPIGMGPCGIGVYGVHGG